MPESAAFCYSVREKCGLAGRTPPTLGSQGAPVTIAALSDFQCPYCARGLRILTKDVLPLYKDKVRVVYLHFPLTGHPWARKAAETMACIGAQNTHLFWSLHDYLFDHQVEIKPNSFDVKIAEQIRLTGAQDFDEAEFHTCVETGKGAAMVDEDLKVGWHHDVTATPTFYINGERAEGVTSAGDWKAAIDRQLHLAATPSKR